METLSSKVTKRGRPLGAIAESALPMEDNVEPTTNNGWHLLFTASTRLDFLRLFINWKKSMSSIENLSIEGLRGAYMPSGEILYYYDFLTCHQYSKVMINKLAAIPIDKLERDFHRYVCMLANDNRVVGKLLQKSVGRKVVWHRRKRPNLEESTNATSL